MKFKIYFHIGLHKTATTSLQEQFFPACRNLNLLTTLNSNFNNFYRYTVFTDPIYFCSEQARKYIEPVLNSMKPNLLSNEAFSGPMFSAVAEYGLDHRDPILLNLSSTFTKAKVIITIRRQDYLAMSIYRQYLKSGGTRKVERFYGFANTPFQPLYNRDRFRYSPYLRRIIDLFPSGVLILVFEEFIKNPHKYLGRIADFLDISLPDIPVIKKNVSRFGPMGLEITRVLNYFFRSYLNPAGFLPGIPTIDQGNFSTINPISYFHDHWPLKFKGKKTGKLTTVAERIHEEVRGDNSLVDKIYKLNLSIYGYY